MLDGLDCEWLPRGGGHGSENYSASRREREVAMVVGIREGWRVLPMKDVSNVVTIW